MDYNNSITIYVSYYLARFNYEGLRKLGYSTWKEAFHDISQKLEVNEHSVKNYRDEFDPLFGHRAGWHQRPLRNTIIRVAQALGELKEPQIRSLVIDILSGTLNTKIETKEILLNVFKEENKIKRTLILRNPTGRAAEEYFIKCFNKKKFPLHGKLIDCRDLGCGYDFEIISNDKKTFIEVKGLAELSGGILFTDKEWNTAKTENSNYILCIVRNANTNPNIQIIKNPSILLQPNKNIYSSIQINWIVPETQLRETND